MDFVLPSRIRLVDGGVERVTFALGLCDLLIQFFTPFSGCLFEHIQSLLLLFQPFHGGLQFDLSLGEVHEMQAFLLHLDDQWHCILLGHFADFLLHGLREDKGVQL